MTRPTARRGAAFGIGGLTLALLLAGTTAGTAVGASDPPAQAKWPDPGENAVAAQPLTVAGQSLTVRPLRNPLVLIQRNVEKTKGTSFTLGADVLFATGEATLTPAASKALDNLAKQIIDAGVTGQADVVGHTDDVGSDGANLTLSRDRAKAVTGRLKTSLANRSITLKAVGRGETQPLAPNRDDASRARNRRVSVVFSGARATASDPQDVAVPVEQPAKAADSVGAPEGSLVSATRTWVAKPDEGTQIRIDVTGVKPVDDMLLIEFLAQSSTTESSFTGLSALFSGRLYSDDLNAAIYDRVKGESLPPVIDGKGSPLAAGTNTWLSPGELRRTWLLFPRPSSDANTPIELYLPGFGVLKVPLAP